jgi:hypothetical protein
LLTAPLLSAPATASEPAQPSVVDPDDPTALAEEALAEVEELLADDGSSTAPAPHEGSDLTLELRDLALLQDELPAAEQQQAASYLARPDAEPNNGDSAEYADGATVERVCSAVVCVHYVVDGDPENAVSSADSDDDGIPNFVETARTEMTRVHKRYVDAGYRPPLPDGAGGSDLPDVYLAQLGSKGLYGYCAPDDADSWDTHAGAAGYCVLDNDYRPKEFPFNTPRENLQVTAAHEYFHNIQFGYDIAEDAWFMEATATWAEDELYDAVDDNTFYLESGPLAKPRVPLDAFRGLYPYGAWVWFRFLTERWDGRTGVLPRIVRQMWEQADAEEGPDRYSLQAIRRVLADRGTTVSKQFARFATVNRRARQHYEEGRRNRYPVTKLAGSARLTEDARARRFEATMDHLTSRSYRFRAARSMRFGWQLRVKLALAPVRRGGAATITVKRVGADARTRTVRLRKDGDRVLRVRFGRNVVEWVEMTIANASTRYECETGASWKHTCRGRARDDDRRQSVSAKAVRG